MDQRADKHLAELSPLPAVLNGRLLAQLRFIVEADKLKTVIRASPLAATERPENSAEHSWHLALMVMLLSEYAHEDIDTGHAIKLVVVHDLVEIYAGDHPVFETTPGNDQVQREESAATRLFGALPTDQASELRTLWDEFEACRTPEARFGKAMDRLEPMLLNWLNKGGTWQTPGVTERSVRAREAAVVAAGTKLSELVDQLVAQGVLRGYIRPDVGRQ